jgi:hypothetical protein
VDGAGLRVSLVVGVGVSWSFGALVSFALVGASVSMGASVLLPEPSSGSGIDTDGAIVMTLADSAALGDAVSEMSVVDDAVCGNSEKGDTGLYFTGATGMPLQPVRILSL